MLPATSPALLPLAEATRHKVQIDWTNFQPFPAAVIGVDRFDATDTAQVRTYLDWTAFFQKWELPLPFPAVLESDEWGEAARSLFADANALLDELLTDGYLAPEVVVGVWKAYADGQHVVVQPDDAPATTLCFLRQQSADSTGPNYCLADFIKPKALLADGETDYIGGYAITLGERLGDKIRQLEAARNDYHVFLTTDLSALYRSALADYLHYRLRRFIWAYCDDDDLSNEEIMGGLHQGIRTELGYDECPDASEGEKLARLLGVDPSTLGLTDDRAAPPAFAVCGYFFAHPRSRNFRIDRISDEQLAQYARCQGLPDAAVAARLTAVL